MVVLVVVAHSDGDSLVFKRTVQCFYINQSSEQIEVEGQRHSSVFSGNLCLRTKVRKRGI